MSGSANLQAFDPMIPPDEPLPTVNDAYYGDDQAPEDAAEDGPLHPADGGDVLAGGSGGGVLVDPVEEVMNGGEYYRDRVTSAERIAAIGTIHLENSWSFWFDEGAQKGMAQEDYEKSIRLLGSFQTIQDFWRYWHHVSDFDKLPVRSNLRLFKTGIKPLWEDPANIEGGKWVIISPKHMTKKIWNDVALIVIGEQLDISEDLCGAVLSVRAKQDTINVWNATATLTAEIADAEEQLRFMLQLTDEVHVEYQVHRGSLEFNRNFREIPRARGRKAKKKKTRKKKRATELPPETREEREARERGEDWDVFANAAKRDSTASVTSVTSVSSADGTDSEPRRGSSVSGARPKKASFTGGIAATTSSSTTTTITKGGGSSSLHANSAPFVPGGSSAGGGGGNKAVSRPPRPVAKTAAESARLKAERAASSSHAAPAPQAAQQQQQKPTSWAAIASESSWADMSDRRESEANDFLKRDSFLKSFGKPSQSQQAAQQHAQQQHGEKRVSFGKGEQKRPSFGKGDKKRPSFGKGDKKRPSFGKGEQKRPSFGKGEQKRPSFGKGEQKRPSFGKKRDSSAGKHQGEKRDSNAGGKQKKSRKQQAAQQQQAAAAAAAPVSKVDADGWQMSGESKAHAHHDAPAPQGKHKQHNPQQQKKQAQQQQQKQQQQQQQVQQEKQARKRAKKAAAADNPFDGLEEEEAVMRRTKHSEVPPELLRPSKARKQQGKQRAQPKRNVAQEGAPLQQLGLVALLTASIALLWAFTN